MANASILAAFERMWQHVVAVVGNKADTDHTHDITDMTGFYVQDTEPTEASTGSVWVDTSV